MRLDVLGFNTDAILQDSTADLKQSQKCRLAPIYCTPRQPNEQQARRARLGMPSSISAPQPAFMVPLGEAHLSARCKACFWGALPHGLALRWRAALQPGLGMLPAAGRAPLCPSRVPCTAGAAHGHLWGSCQCRQAPPAPWCAPCLVPHPACPALCSKAHAPCGQPRAPCALSGATTARM